VHGKQLVILFKLVHDVDFVDVSKVKFTDEAKNHLPPKCGQPIDGGDPGLLGVFRQHPQLSCGMLFLVILPRLRILALSEDL
jgi:hypothetical protein